MKEYNYLVFYNLGEKDTAKIFKRQTTLTIHDLNGNMIADEVFKEIVSRVQEMEECEEYRTYVEITNVCLLNLHQ